MAADTQPNLDSSSRPCCALIKQRYSKLEEKRNALRKAVKLLEQEVSKLQTENHNVKKTYEEERARAEAEIANKGKESAARVGLETELASLQVNKGSSDQDADGEAKLLQTQIEEAEEEINKLKVLLDDERKSGELEKKKAETEKKKAEKEKKKAEAEKKKASEALKLVNAEKNKVEEERRVSDAERSRTDEFRLRAEASEAEVDHLKSLADEFRLRTEASEAEINRLKSLVDEFRLRAEASEAEVNRLNGLLEKEMKKEAEKKRADVEKEKAAEAWKLVKSERKKFEEERKVADIERSRAEEYRLSLEASKAEANDVKAELVSERSKTEEALRWLEVEKLKANQEKERAELEMAKAEEQRQCVEEEKQKLVAEKNHSHHLSQQLEEERERNKALEKELQEMTSAKTMEKAHKLPMDTMGDAVDANILLLKKELKLGKLHVKHAKRVAKFEKLQNTLLKKEVTHLKQDFMRFARHLSILDDCFSDGREGIDAPVKFRNSLELQSSNSNGKFSGNEPFALYDERKILKAHRTSVGNLDHDEPPVKCSTPYSVGGCTKSISGISSELESVIGVSVGNNSQTSAMYSTSTTLSDRPLVGSQGNHAFTVTSPAKLREKNLNNGSTIPRFSGDRTNDNLPMDTENNVRSVIHGLGDSSLSNLNGHNSIRVLGGRPVDSRKRMRSEDALPATDSLSSKDKLHTQVEEEFLDVHNALILNDAPPAVCSQSDGMLKALGDGRFPTALLDNLHGTQSSKKRKVSKEQKLTGEACIRRDIERQSGALHSEVSKDEGALTEAGPRDDWLVESVQVCSDETALYSDEEALNFIEKMISGDYMQLLELDNSDDELRYRMAIDAPLSPTLPEIEMPNMEAINMGDSKNLVDEGLGNEEDTLAPSCSFDVIDVEIDSDRFNPRSSGKSDDFVLRQIKEADNSLEVHTNEENASHIATNMRETLDNQVFESNPEISEVKQMSVFCEGREDEKLSRYLVVFPNIKDNSSIARMVAAFETCISKSFMVSQKVWVVEKILSALAMDENMLPKEKACVLFSLLLYNFSVVTQTSFKNFLTGGSTLCSDSFSMHMETVISDLEAKNSLLEPSQLDTLLLLIEGFLIDRRVLVYHDALCSQPVLCDSGIIISNDDRTITVSFKAASPDQMISGSIILASICATTGHIGFVCETTYNLLRNYASDSYVMLTMLHVFATTCGTKYLTLSNYSLIMTVVKSIVMLLERENAVDGVVRASILPSSSEIQFEFPICSQCLFSEGAIFMDEVASLLLEQLQNHVGPNHNVSHIKSAELTIEPELGFGGLDVLATFHSDSADCRNFNHFSDILSLVELVACYMRWDWTWTKVIPQLLMTLELCLSEKFSAAIFTLVSQLGRFGIDDSGHEQLGVEELRCSLSTCLDQKAGRKWGLPTQYAILHALIGLLSVDFGELVKSVKGLPADASISVHANRIRLWFSQLTEEQKAFTFALFQ